MKFSVDYLLFSKISYLVIVTYHYPVMHVTIKVVK